MENIIYAISQHNTKSYKLQHYYKLKKKDKARRTYP